MSELAEEITSRVEFEIGQIDHLLAVYADLLARTRERQPDVVETAALALLLHSFYNGLENIFRAVAKTLDEARPDGPNWHRELLVQASQKTAVRDRIVSVELAARLSDYLGFRHVCRHSYSFVLEWSRLRDLVMMLGDTWAQVKAELEEFVAALSAGEDRAQEEDTE